MRSLLRLIVVVIIAAALVKYGVPWFKDHFKTAPKATAGAAADTPCAESAAAASSTWGDGIGRFVNPPYDIAAWDTFHSTVEEKIRVADSNCSCSQDSCEKAHSAMNDLRALVSQLDTSIRNGSAPPDDAVRQQERIDQQIDEARDLVRQGK